MSLTRIRSVSLLASASCRNLQNRTRSGSILRSFGHSVRLIVRQDLEDGRAYKDDVITVKGGYARNYLIPNKKAVYATRENFTKFNLQDPDQETAEERQARLVREAAADEDKDLKAADLLKNYLRSKVVRYLLFVDTLLSHTEQPAQNMAQRRHFRHSTQLDITRNCRRQGRSRKAFQAIAN